MDIRSSMAAMVFLGALAFPAYGEAPADSSRPLAALRHHFASHLSQFDSVGTLKCGTSLRAMLQMEWHELPAMKRSEYARALARRPRQKSRLSPSGRFRIHYDTTGVNTPSMLSGGLTPIRLPSTYETYVDSIAAIADEVWRVQIEELGYRPPPADGQKGGGPEYDIYISELSSSTFGLTTWEEDDLVEDGRRQRFATSMEIDNDYFGYRTGGLDGARVTLAHEFHHAIQVGGYGIWTTVPNSDFYFYELTAVWMEDVIFTTIDDYLFDVPTYFRRFRDFQNRSYPFTSYGFSSSFGYERSIWAHFLAKRFGTDVMREIWSGMLKEPSLRSTDAVLRSRGSDLESEFALFSSWNYYTANRADTARFYPEGNLYPRFVPNIAASLNGMSATIATGGYPLSTQLFEFILPADTITAVVANIDVARALGERFDAEPFEIRLTTGDTRPPFQRLTKGMTAGFSSGESGKWRMLYLESSSRASVSTASDPSPNPLRLSQAARLLLPLSGTRGSDVEVSFLSSSLDLAHSGRYPIIDSFGTRLAYVPVADLQIRLSSGVYFVMARTEDREFLWKIVVLR